MDAMSGVAGYAVQFDDQASWVCDKVLRTSTTQATGSVLNDGDWYAHVCAADLGGNWSPVADAGPFVIEGVLFADGLEVGSTAAWSAAVP